MYADPDTEDEWSRWERRNPGVMHPDRRKHQISQQMTHREQEAAPYREDLPHEVSVAARGRAARSGQRRF